MIIRIVKCLCEEQYRLSQSPFIVLVALATSSRSQGNRSQLVASLGTIENARIATCWCVISE